MRCCFNTEGFEYTHDHIHWNHDGAGVDFMNATRSLLQETRCSWFVQRPGGQTPTDGTDSCPHVCCVRENHNCYIQGHGSEQEAEALRTNTHLPDWSTAWAVSDRVSHQGIGPLQCAVSAVSVGFIVAELNDMLILGDWLVDFTVTHSHINPNMHPRWDWVHGFCHIVLRALPLSQPWNVSVWHFSQVSNDGM